MKEEVTACIDMGIKVELEEIAKKMNISFDDLINQVLENIVKNKGI